jgi:hypothetical protein
MGFTKNFVFLSQIGVLTRKLKIKDLRCRETLDMFPRTRSTKIELKKQPTPSLLERITYFTKKGTNRRGFLEELGR